VPALPAGFLAPFLPWLDRRAVLCGWAVGMAWGTYLLVDAHFATSTVTLAEFGHHYGMYMGVPTAAANLIVAFAGSAVVALARRARRAGSPAIG